MIRLQQLQQYGTRLLTALWWWARRDGYAFGLFVALALFALAPVVPAPRTHILGAPGDNVLYAYMTGWAAQSLLLHESPLVDPRMNYPDDLPLPTNDAPYLSMVSVAPITWALGNVAGYNTILLISHVLSGYVVYLWLVSITGSRIGGIIAGAAFLLAPYRIGKSLGHLNLVSTQTIPLFFWALDNTLTKQHHKEYHWWLLALATALVAAMSEYYLIICLVTGAAYGLFRLLATRRYAVRVVWRVAVSVALGALIGSLPAISVAGCGGFVPYTIGSTRMWSADPTSFLLPSRLHPWWGEYVNRIVQEPLVGEKTLYVGAVVSLLALVALLWRTHNAKRFTQYTYVWLATALVAALFALGTDLHINNQPINTTTPLWLPAYYLAHIPFVNIMRVWSRFGIITILCITLLAGIGTTRLMARFQRARLPIAAVLLALLIVDFLPGNLDVMVLEPRPIDTWLAAQPGDFAVAFLPVEKHRRINDRALFGSLWHGKHMPAFVHSQHVPRAYHDFAAIAIHFPEKYAIERLSERNIRYLLLEQREFNGWRAPRWEQVAETLATTPLLRVVANVDGVIVVEFVQ